MAHGASAVPFRCQTSHPYTGGRSAGCEAMKMAGMPPGVVADGEKTLDEAGADLYRLVLEVASGKKTRAEEKGFREISIFKDGVVL